ncbi:MAG: SH3 domain-containing protein, partial [Candidatus Promineifilaceae bacterium]
VTPSPSSTPTSAPTAVPEPLFRVLASSANLRFGPGTNFDPIGYVYQADELEIIGRSTGDYIWLNVQTADGRRGWVAADVGEMIGTGSMADVQIVVTLPLPPAATYTQVPTETPIAPSPLPSLATADGGSDGNDGNGSGGNSGGGDGNNQPRATPTPPF